MSISKEIGLNLLNKSENAKELARWTMRQYFTDQHKDKVWFNENVTEDNVFEYIADYKNNFPHSPGKFVDFYKTVQDARKQLERLTDINVSSAPQTVKEAPRIRGPYSKGEETMANIAEEISLTCTMAGKIITRGLQKLNMLCGDENFLDPNGFDVTEINRRIARFENEAADFFSKTLKQYENDAEAFITTELMENNCFIREADLPWITDDERHELNNLSLLDEEDIREVLVFDFKQENRLFKTFQYVFSKMLYRDLKREYRAKYRQELKERMGF